MSKQPALFTDLTHKMPHLKPIVTKPTNIEEIICSNRSLTNPEKIVGSNFLSKDVLLSKLRTILSQEAEDKTTLNIGSGVCEIISSASQQLLYDLLKRVGKQASTKVVPNVDVKVSYLRTPTDELRKAFKIKNEKKPKQNERQGEYKREVTITMKDVMACRRFLPERSVYMYEKKKYENMKLEK